MLPGPTEVPESVSKALSRHIVSHRKDAWHKLYTRIQLNLKYLFQTENDVYTLTASGTGAVECAVSNLVEKNDKVIVPTNGEFGMRLADIVEVYGGNVIRINAEWGDWADPSLIEEEIKRNPDVKLVAFVYNETSTGVRNPAKEIVKVAKDNGVLVLCDSVSNLGGDELYMDKWGIDIVVSGSQKAIAMPPGLSFISLNEEAWKKVEQNRTRTNYYFSLPKIRKFHEKNETPFTPAISLFYGLDEALKIIKEEGLENRIKRHLACSRALISGVEAMGLQMLPKKKEYCSRTVNAIKNPPGVDDALIRKYLLEKYGISIAGGIGPTKGKVFRIGTMGIVNKDHIYYTLKALEEALLNVGVKVTPRAGLEAAKKTFEEYGD